MDHGDDSDNESIQDLDDGAVPEVQDLINAWRTEINCPEILKYQADLVEYLTQRMKDIENEIDEDTVTTAENPDAMFTLMIKQMDVDRVKFSLSRYLRARIEKIEDQLHYISDEDDTEAKIIYSRLSEHEKSYVQDLLSLYNRHFEEAIFKNIKDREELDKEQYLKKDCKPFLNQFVFTRETEGNDEDISVSKYDKIRDEVISGKKILL